jgi:copper chaperone
MATTRLEIQGMSCGHCLTAVQKALDEVPGVQTERVELGSAVVEHDPALASAEFLRAAVEQAGYPAVIL